MAMAQQAWHDVVCRLQAYDMLCDTAETAQPPGGSEAERRSGAEACCMMGVEIEAQRMARSLFRLNLQCCSGCWCYNLDQQLEFVRGCTQRRTVERVTSSVRFA